MRPLCALIVLAGLFAGAPHSDAAECQCTARCVVSCINNFDTISTTSMKANLEGGKCVGNTLGHTLDEVCVRLGFKGIAPHDKDHKDKPPLWCPEPTCG